MAGLEIRSNGVIFTRPGLPTIWTPKWIQDALLGWWKAYAGVTADGSGRVSAVADQSGYAGGQALVQATSGNQPLLVANSQAGKPGIYNDRGAAVASWLSTAANPFPSQFLRTTPFSVACVFKRGILTLANGFGTICGTAAPMSRDGHGIFVLASKLRFGIGNSIATGSVIEAPSVLSPGSVYVVIATFDGSGSATGMKLYVNGSLTTTSVVSDTLSAQSDTNAFRTSKFTLGGNASTTLGTDDVAYEALLANRVLTGLEVKAMSTYLNQRMRAY